MSIQGSLVAALILALPIAQNAGQLLNQIDSLKPPQRESSTDMGKFWAETEKYKISRENLILQFYAKAPKHPRTPDLMEWRWLTMEDSNDIDKILAKPVTNEVKEIGYYVKSRLAIDKAYLADKDGMVVVIQFAKQFPNSKKMPNLLLYLATDYKGERKWDLLRRIINQYPTTEAAKEARLQIRQHESISKAFELKFKDAISGNPVDVADMKGKVILIDFWATWCVPCCAELPHIKELYTKYHAQGLEVIGISLDKPEAQGGLTALRKYAAEHDLPWPQYFQGNYWNGAFSASWNIRSIPEVFLVSKEGKLAKTGVKREELEAEIKKLLGVSLSSVRG